MCHVHNMKGDKMLTQKELDTYAAETLLTHWAQGHADTQTTIDALKFCGFEIDFWQEDIGATMVGEYVPTGEFIELGV